MFRQHKLAPGERGHVVVLLLFTCIIVLAVGYYFWHLSRRDTNRRYGWPLLWRMAFLISKMTDEQLLRFGKAARFMASDS